MLERGAREGREDVVNCALYVFCRGDRVLTDAVMRSVSDTSRSVDRPVPPAAFTHLGNKYVLVSNQSVRQGSENVEIRDKRGWVLDTPS